MSEILRARRQGIGTAMTLDLLPESLLGNHWHPLGWSGSETLVV